MKLNQSYYNIATGVTISVLVALILMGVGWVAKMQVTVNKADLALREAERNNKQMQKKTRTLHIRITDNHKKLETVSEMAIRADTLSKINRTDILKDR